MPFQALGTEGSNEKKRQQSFLKTIRECKTDKARRRAATEKLK